MRFLLAILVVAVVLEQTAYACGVWQLHDADGAEVAEVLIRSTTMPHRRAHTVSVNLDSYTAKVGDRRFVVKGGVLREGGRTAAQILGQEIHINGKVFDVQFDSDLRRGIPHAYFASMKVFESGELKFSSPAVMAFGCGNDIEANMSYQQRTADVIIRLAIILLRLP